MIPDVPYRFVVRPLTDEEGGGYLIEFPDLPGCMSAGSRRSRAPMVQEATWRRRGRASSRLSNSCSRPIASGRRRH